jgi:hypothetical protein
VVVEDAQRHDRRTYEPNVASHPSQCAKHTELHHSP